MVQTASCVRFEDVVVKVASSNEHDLAWLSEFLRSGFEIAGNGDEPDYEVALTVDSAGYERLSAAAPKDRATVEGFARDAKPALLERWPSMGPELIYHDRRKRIFYRLCGGGSRVEILACEQAPKSRLALMKVVRELVMARVVSTGGTLFHGAAVACGDDVVVMCGPKGSGKTTLLLSLLTATPAHYVSNDRCVVRLASGRATVRGLPTLVSIRRDTLDRFPRLRSAVGADGCDAPLSAPLRISPAELLRALDIEHAPAGNLRALVFPQVVAGASRLALRRLACGEALGRIEAGLFRASNDRLLGEVFVSSHEAAHRLSARKAAERTICWLSENVPAFDCELAPGTIPGPEECRALLGSALGPAGRVP